MQGTDQPAESTLWRYRVFLSGLGLALVSLLAYLLLRVPGLDRLPLFFDEANYAVMTFLLAHDPLHTDPFIFVAYWGVPPLFSWCAAPFTLLAISPVLAGRVFSVCIGIVGMGGIYGVGRLLGGRLGGAIAAGLWIICPFMVWYQRMALVDALLATVATFALWASVWFLERPSRRRGALLGGAIALAVLSKITGPLVFLFPLMLLFVVSRDDRSRARSGVGTSVIIGLAAVLILLLSPGSSSFFEVASQHQRASVPYIDQSVRQLGMIAETGWIYVTAPILLLACVGAVCGWRTPGWRLIVYWTSCSLVAFIVVHLQLTSRYLLPIVPAILLLASQGARVLVESTRAAQRRAVWYGMSTAVLIVTLAWSVQSDIRMLGDARRAPLTADDRSQYVTGWSAGYALAAAIDRLKRRAPGHIRTLIVSRYNPPANEVFALVHGGPGFQVRTADLAHLRATSVQRGGTYVLYQSPYGPRPRLTHNGLHLLFSIPVPDGSGSIDVLVR